MELVNILGKLQYFLGKLSMIIEPVPPEYQEKFERAMLANSVFRIRFLAVFILAQHIVKRILLFYSVDTFEIFFSLISSRDDIFHYYLEYGFFAVPSLFIVFSAVFSKTKNTAALWSCCYTFVFYFCSAALLNIYFAASTLELVSLFTIIIFLLLFVPDFKYRIMPSLAYYIATMLITSRLSVPYVAALHYVLSFIYVSGFMVERWHYNNRVKVFVCALKMKELNKKYEALSVTDELTKIDNRRAFINYFEMIWKQSIRLQLPINVLMIDIDYFKKYNDSLGHLKGDKALIAVAQCLKKMIKRATDFVARFGGEEFVCVLTHINKEEAEVFARKLVQSIENLKIPHPQCEHSPYLTISAGMASIVPQKDVTPKQLLDKADKALYEAKHSGRNKVETYKG